MLNTKYKEVNVIATASSQPMLLISFKEDDNESTEYELSEQQVKWLIKALKQGRDLAFK